MFLGCSAAIAAPKEGAAKGAEAQGRIEIVTITDADNNKTVAARVDQEVRVSLKGDRPQTGWEVSQRHGTALAPVIVGGSYGDATIPATEFVPDQQGVEDLGTYTFRYRAIAPGKCTLRFVFVYPGGSRPTARTATKLVREFNVTVDVAGNVATRPATSPADKGGLAGQAQTVLTGTAIAQVDHNAVVDRSRYNMILEVVGERDNLTRYAVRINPVSQAFIARDKGAKPVTITGTVEQAGQLKVITPTKIDRVPLEIKK